MARRLIPVALILLCSGCSFFEGDEGSELRFAVDAWSYATDELVEATGENQSSSALFFPHCCGEIGFYIEQWQATGWERVGYVNLICNDFCAGGPIPLEAGERFTEEFALREPGRYRLALPYGNQRSELEETAYSQEFTVQEARLDQRRPASRQRLGR